MPRGYHAARIALAVALVLLAVWAATRQRETPAAVPARLPSTPPARTRGVTLTFWNLEWFPGHRPNAEEPARQKHVAAAVPVLERLDPDVLGLEEIFDASAAGIITSHLKGFRVDACSEFRRPSGELTHQQTVLCSRLPLVNAWWESWRPRPDGLQPRRGFVFAAYQPAPGELLLVYGVHLKSNVADEPGGLRDNLAMREEAGRQLRAHARSMAEAYARMGRVRLMVIGGDMNTSLDDPRFGAETTLRALLEESGFRWAWSGVPLERRLTLPAKGHYPAVCFDHQLYRSDEASSPVLSASIEQTGHDASDHRPVTVRYAW